MKILISIFGISLLFVSLIGCDDENNIKNNATIDFLQPIENTIFENSDTILFSLDPSDSDSMVSRIELFINDSLMHVMKDAPFEFQWYSEALIEPGIYMIKAVAYNDNELMYSNEIIIEIVDFRDKYLGNYFFTLEGGCNGNLEISYYDGWIKKFEASDTIVYYDGLDNYKNDTWTSQFNKRITIQIAADYIYTPTLLVDPRYPNPERGWLDGFAYGGGRSSIGGAFVTTDSLIITSFGSGGGGSCEYTRIGERD